MNKEKIKQEKLSKNDILELTDKLDKLSCNSIEYIKNDSEYNKILKKIQDKISILLEESKLQDIYKTTINQELINNLDIILSNAEKYKKIYNQFYRINNNNIVSFYIKDIENNYIEIINKYIKNIYKSKYQEYVSLSLEIIGDKIKYISDLDDNIDFNSKEKSNNKFEITKNKLTNQENAIPKYLSYAYSEKSKVTLQEAYEDSVIKEISDMGKEIIETIIKINKLYCNKNNENLYIDNCDDFGLLSLTIRDIADDDLKFKSLITYLYKGIYEFTNKIKDSNSLYKLCNDFGIDSKGLDLIKWYRAHEQHTSSKTDKKKIKNVYEFNKEVIGKNFPEKPSDFVKIQHAIYKNIFSMLSLIYQNMNEIK